MTALGLSPTLARALLPHGAPDADLSSLRTFVTTGEPWNPEPYRWLFEDVGGSRVPVINCTGGTEVGACFLSPTPIGPIKACSVGGPALGMAMDVVDDDGHVARRHRRGRRARLPQAVPRHDARLLARPRQVHRDVLVADSRRVGARRLGVRRRRRLLVPARPLRRHAEHRRQAHRPRRARVGRGRPPRRARGGGDRRPARGQGRDGVDLLLPAAGRRGDRSRRRRTRRRRARQGVQARPGLLRRRAPEDAVGEDRPPRGARRRRSEQTPAICRRSRTRSRSTRSGSRCADGSRSHHRRRARDRREHRALARAKTAGTVVVTARSRDQIDAVAAEIGGRAVRAGRRRRARRCERGFGEIGHVDLLVANAGDRQRRRLLADVRGERARRPPLLRGGARAPACSPHRDHGQRRGLPAGFVEHLVHLVEGGGVPLRRDAEQRGRRSRSS